MGCTGLDEIKVSENKRNEQLFMANSPFKDKLSAGKLHLCIAGTPPWSGKRDMRDTLTCRYWHRLSSRNVSLKVIRFRLVASFSVASLQRRIWIAPRLDCRLSNAISYRRGCSPCRTLYEHAKSRHSSCSGLSCSQNHPQVCLCTRCRTHIRCLLCIGGAQQGLRCSRMRSIDHECFTRRKHGLFHISLSL